MFQPSRMTTYFAIVYHMFYTCIQGNDKGICENPLMEDRQGTCCTNFYRDGDICKECPPGYIGFNCSEICPEQSYGHFCSLECGDCINCNHVYGCKFSTDASRQGGSSTRPATAIMSSKPSINTSYVYENISSSILVSLNGNKTKLNLAIIIYTTGSLISFVILLIIVIEIRNICKISFPQTNKNKPDNTIDVENIYSEVSDVINGVISRKEIAASMLNVNSNDEDKDSEISEGDCTDCIYSIVYREKEETGELDLSLQTSRFEAGNTLGPCTNKTKIKIIKDCPDEQNKITFHQIAAKENNKEILSPESSQSSTDINGREIEIAMSDISQDTSPSYVQFVLVNETTETTSL